MAIAAPPALPTDLAERVRATVVLLERRGYSLPANRLGGICLGGPVSEAAVVASLAPAALRQVDGIVCSEALLPAAATASRRQAGHLRQSAPYLAEAVAFAHLLARLFPFVIAVSIAGSLASGGFTETDDVDLNLVVEDGYRHVAYFALNALGVLHALRHRGKPVDSLSARPISPRVMTANLLLERSQCFPLARTDADMAYELLASIPVIGARFLAEVVAANGALLTHFPQLADRPPTLARDPRGRVPRWVYPRILDVPARALGLAAWRYLQWTRRKHPEAVARVAYVRETMRPYTLFE